MILFKVQSCSGCKSLVETIEEGTTSSSSESTTSSWSISLSDTVKEGVIFESDELTTSVSTSISNTCEQAYSQHESKSCQATCGNGTTQANLYMYQWQMNAQEYIGADTSPFDILVCQWVCNTESSPPKCPPGYCADPACQKCKSYYYL